MRKFSKAVLFLAVSMLISSCEKNGSYMDNNQNPSLAIDEKFQGGKDFRREKQFGSEGSESIEVQDQIKYISEDCVENYLQSTSLAISFTGTNAFYDSNVATEKGITIYRDEDNESVIITLQKQTEGKNSEEQGITIEYKGNKIIRYVLSGTLEGTLKIKNKNADCIVELDGLTIISSENGPAIQFTSEKRTFLVVKEDASNILTDNRILSENQEIINDKKGSVYAKGPLIITGTTSKNEGGNLTIINKGYKHGIYSHDYVRVAEVTLSVNCEGETSRDCIRALNGVIVDGGKLDLVTKGAASDAEGCGIKVEGEDSDEDKKEVEYTAGAGFIVINGGNINIESYAKGITAHWKSNESVIGKTDYKEIQNKSLLFESEVLNSSAVKPEPYFIMNGGSLKIKTSSINPRRNWNGCAPEGIETKADIIINEGNIVVESSDDAINAGASVTINGGTVYAKSLTNDAVDANGRRGIIINGGNIFGIATNSPECAFDSDQNPLNINGGTVIGFGSSNITYPADTSKQNVVVLGTSGFSGKKLEIIQNGKTNISCDLSDVDRSEVLIFSSENLSKGDFSVSIDGKDVATGKIEDTITMVNYSENGFGGGRGGMGRGTGDFENFGKMPNRPEGRPKLAF